jgi:hypothetical protein
VDNLKELLKHPGWQEYLDEIESQMVGAFAQIFQLDSAKAESFVKFVELKGRIDQLRDITYFVERQVADDIETVDVSYGKRFAGLLKRIFTGGKHV